MARKSIGRGNHHQWQRRLYRSALAQHQDVLPSVSQTAFDTSVQYLSIAFCVGFLLFATLVRASQSPLDDFLRMPSLTRSI